MYLFSDASAVCCHLAEIVIVLTLNFRVMYTLLFIDNVRGLRSVVCGHLSEIVIVLTLNL